MSDNHLDAPGRVRPMTAATRTSAATLDLIVSALRRGDLARAEAALLAGPIEAEPLLRLAELNLRRQRWADAAWLLEHAQADLPPEFAFKRNLCRNMAALSVHRPDVCRLLAATRPDDAVYIARSQTGHPTIAIRQPDGSSAGLSAENRPLDAAETALQRLRPAMGKGLAIGLAGMGDGYLLYRLAHDRTKLFLGLTVPVFVIEPDPRIVLHALMIHDYSGQDGPIEQQRFNWLVGPDWVTQFRDICRRDPMLGAPALTVSFTDAGPAIRAELHAVSQEAAEQDSQTAARIAAYYGSRDPATPFAENGSSGDGRPRVLLLTTRFSTVLQYSTRDTAVAFEQLGWDTKVLIEPSSYHRLYQPAIRRVVEAFKPDLVFQIDHLRHEHGNLFPPNLPFMCWVQDHLPHLTTPAVGTNVGPTDFVLTDTADTYQEKYQYPRRQLLALPKLTKPIVTPTISGGSGPDLVFVSNASRPPALILDQLCAGTSDPVSQRLIRACGQRILAVYAAGGSLQTYFGDLVPLIDEVIAGTGLTATRPQVDEAARVLFHPLNDALYRQQALAWAAAAADALGLRMELYGAGWEAHPSLSRFARGPIDPASVHALTASTAINLQIVPYLCLHQRLLDGVMAGGFFLIRKHSADIHPGRLLSFLADQGLGSCQDTAAALAAVEPEYRSLLDRLVRAARPAMCTTGGEDVVRMVRQWHEAGQLDRTAGPLPCFQDVSFDSADSLRRHIERFIANPDARQNIVQQQQASIARRLTYEAGIKRVVCQMQTLLQAGQNLQEAPISALEAA